MVNNIVINNIVINPVSPSETWRPLGGPCDTTRGPVTCLSISLAVSRQHLKVIVVVLSSPGGWFGFLPVHSVLLLPRSCCKAFWDLKSKPFFKGNHLQRSYFDYWLVCFF